MKFIHNNNGPAKFPLQIRVSVKDIVTFRQRASYIRQLEAQQKMEKKPDDAKISKMADNVASGKDVDTQFAAGFRADEVARTLAASAVGYDEEWQEDALVLAMARAFLTTCCW